MTKSLTIPVTPFTLNVLVMVSTVWEHFTKDTDLSRCNYCSATYSYKKKVGTSNLWRHLQSKHSAQLASSQSSYDELCTKLLRLIAVEKDVLRLVDKPEFHALFPPHTRIPTRYHLSNLLSSSAPTPTPTTPTTPTTSGPCKYEWMNKLMESRKAKQTSIQEGNSIPIKQEIDDNTENGVDVETAPNWLDLFSDQGEDTKLLESSAPTTQTSNGSCKYTWIEKLRESRKRKPAPIKDENSSPIKEEINDNSGNGVENVPNWLDLFSNQGEDTKDDFHSFQDSLECSSSTQSTPTVQQSLHRDD